MAIGGEGRVGPIGTLDSVISIALQTILSTISLVALAGRAIVVRATVLPAIQSARRAVGTLEVSYAFARGAIVIRSGVGGAGQVTSGA